MDLAPNYSPRYVFDYTSAYHTHKFTVREARGATRNDEAVITKVNAVLTAAAPLMFNGFAVRSCTFYPQDEFTGLPVDIDGVFDFSPGVGADSIRQVHAGLQTRWESRGNAGGRGAFVLFGLNTLDITGGPKADFRLYSTENTAIAAVVTALSELSPSFVPLGSTGVVWRPYANVKVNDYWLRKAIRG